MIVASQFNLEVLLGDLLHQDYRRRWRREAEIIVRYIPPYAGPDTPSRCVVRYGNHFLRHSAGPLQGHFWDSYGDDYLRPELALIALLQAEPPPSLFKWRETTDPGEQKGGERG